MERYNLTLDTISSNCSEQEREDVKHVLILYEEERLAIGDCCVRLANLRYLREYFPNAVININFVNTAYMHIYGALLHNNPSCDGIFTNVWRDIDFPGYDAVFFGAYNEDAFVEFLHGKYAASISSGHFKTAVYSFSQFILPPRADMKFFFPLNEKLLEYTMVKYPVLKPNEVYLKSDEQLETDKWLESNGVKKNESLVIFLDSTARKNKLVRIDVYFDVLLDVLKRDDIKVLVFDEKSVGKEEFYREWIGEKNMQKMIFSKSRSFRDDIAVLGSGYVRMIFGPCTGLLHCASGIYNNLVSNGLDMNKVPDLITYTGQYTAMENNANHWWGNSPLVNCLLLSEKNGKKEIVLLSSLTQEEKLNYKQIPASEYTAGMLSSFINTKLDAWHSKHTTQEQNLPARQVTEAVIR
jgi:ADP-heptose:LPS heptosyltransferase